MCRNQRSAAAASRIAAPRIANVVHFLRDPAADAVDEMCAGAAAGVEGELPALTEDGAADADMCEAGGGAGGAEGGISTAAGLRPDPVSRFNL